MLKKYILIVVTMCLLWACQDTNNTTKRLTEINPTIDLPVVRIDRQILSQSLDSLVQNHPAFMDVYLRQIMVLPPDREVIQTELARMLSDTSYLKLQEDVDGQYPDLESVTPRIAQAIENYMNLFGVKETPSIYTFISGFVYQTFLFDDNGRDGIGVGLDMFLGDDFPYEQIDPTNVRFSQYLTRTYNKAHMARKVAQVLAEDQLTPPNKNDFLSLMIWNGKRQYIVDQILSFEPDSIVTEYTAEQHQWCVDNEAQMWEYFFDQNLFYETDMRKFTKIIAPAPSSPGMPAESPGNTATYMGWRIVQAYMLRHPGTDIHELVELDPQKILDGSKYKPGR